MDKSSLYYKMVKIQVLGLSYGAGWKRFLKICADGGIDIAKDDPEWVEEIDQVTGEVKKVPGYGANSRRIVSEFRKAAPQITGLWQRLDDAFKRSIGQTFVMGLPSGRKMSYRNVRYSVRIEPDAKGRPRKKWVFTGESDGRQKIFYGSLLTENITQSVARDVFAYHLLRLEDTPGIRVLYGVHDESVLECDQNITTKQVEQIMSECPEWLPGCPIAAEAREVAHYCK